MIIYGMFFLSNSVDVIPFRVYSHADYAFLVLRHIRACLQDEAHLAPFLCFIGLCLEDFKETISSRECIEWHVLDEILCVALHSTYNIAYAIMQLPVLFIPLWCVSYG